MKRLLPIARPADTAHGERPWVYFMIDCFFLVTQFFVITFHIKTDEGVLPQNMPPGQYGPNTSSIVIKLDPGNIVRVHVARADNAAVYECMQQPCSLADLQAALSRAKSAGVNYSVRLSYEPTVPYGDVLAVFNICARLGIEKCGLVPLRSVDALYR